MQKVNELFGKEVIDQASGEKRATVHDVVFDEGTRGVVALLVGGLLGRDRVVRRGSIVSLGDVVVAGGEAPFVKLGDDPEVKDLRGRKGRRITGTDVVSEGKEKIGAVADLFVDDSGRVIGYEVKRGLVGDLSSRRFLPVEKVRAAGEDAIIASDPALPSVKDVEKDRG